MRMKRWGFLALFGLLILMLGAAVSIESRQYEVFPLPYRVAQWVIKHIHLGVTPGVLGAGMIVGGALLGIFALLAMMRSVAIVLEPELSAGELVDVIYRRRKLAQGKRIVVIGGGTGLSTMLRGLKQYTSNITAIVTVADDGGSSGKLKRQLNILPPGDIRNCLVALADDETQMTELFQFRFGSSVNPELKKNVASASELNAPSLNYGEGLRDHAFGNLLIAAMCAINQGDFHKAVKETSRVLNIRGTVLPTTVTHVHLRGEMEDGTFEEGESNIAHSPKKIKRISMVPENACPLPEVLEAIQNAELIVMGPGSVYTSIIPNLLVSGVSDALRQSKAKKVYICNVMTQPGETDGFSAFDHVRAIEKHAKMKVFDFVLVNKERPKSQLMEKYDRYHSVLVEPDTDRIKSEGYRPIAGDFINQTDVVRHDANKLARAIMKLLG